LLIKELKKIFFLQKFDPEQRLMSEISVIRDIKWDRALLFTLEVKYSCMMHSIEKKIIPHEDKVTVCEGYPTINTHCGWYLLLLTRSVNTQLALCGA
jgi:hypothetical protein